QAGGIADQCPGLWRRRTAGTGWPTAARSGAGRARRGGTALPGHRHSRQPRLPAITAGSRRGWRRATGAGYPGGAPEPGGGRLAGRRLQRRGAVRPAGATGDQRSRSGCPAPGGRHRRSAGGSAATPVPRPLFLLLRQQPLRPPDLPHARGQHRRPWRARDPGPRRPAALRPRRGVRRDHRLRRRRVPARALRRGYRTLLPGARRHAPASGLLRRAPQAVRPRGTGRRLRHPNSCRAWPGRTGQPVRHRIPGAHRQPGDCRACRRVALRRRYTPAPYKELHKDWSMKAFGKILGLVVLGLLLIVIGLGFALTHLFDPNDYKDELQQLARDEANLELHLNGDIGWSLFPWLGLELTDATLASADSPEKPFANVRLLGLPVRVLPLLYKEVQMSDIR